MKNKVTFFLIILIFLSAGCKKDEDQENIITLNKWILKGFTPLPTRANDTAVYYHSVPGDMFSMYIHFSKNNTWTLRSACNFVSGNFFILNTSEIHPEVTDLAIGRIRVFHQEMCDSIEDNWEGLCILALRNAWGYMITNDTLKIYSNGEYAYDDLVFSGGELVFTAEGEGI